MISCIACNFTPPTRADFNALYSPKSAQRLNFAKPVNCAAKENGLQLIAHFQSPYC